MQPTPMAWHGHSLRISLPAAYPEHALEWGIRLGQRLERARDIDSLKLAVGEMADEISMTATVAIERRGHERDVVITFAAARGVAARAKALSR